MAKYWIGLIVFVYFLSIACLGIVIFMFEVDYVQVTIKETAILALILFTSYCFLRNCLKLRFEYVSLPIFFIICYFLVSLYIAKEKINYSNMQTQKPEIEKPIGRIARG